MKSILLTSIQFLCIGWILYFNDWLVAGAVLMVVQLMGLVLGGWAIFVMSRSKLNVTPVPRKGASLVTSGPYSLIRHPMYTAVILALFPILVNDASLSNSIVFGMLLINLLLKLHYEEKLLQEVFPKYSALKSRTWRLIPWIY